MILNNNIKKTKIVIDELQRRAKQVVEQERVLAAREISLNDRERRVSYREDKVTEREFKLFRRK